MQPLKIIIADDHALFIDGLCSLLDKEAGFEVCFVAHTANELLQHLTKNTADIVLLDINMPGMNGLDAMRYVRQRNTQIKIVVLSTYGDAQLIEIAKERGANGYLLKNSSKDELLQTIKIVMDGKTSFPYKPPKDNSIFTVQDDFLKQYSLTKREREILQLLKQEKTNQQIADALFLSIYTVETHRKNIMQKLGLSSPAALMKFIVENGV